MFSFFTFYLTFYCTILNHYSQFSLQKLYWIHKWINTLNIILHVRFAVKLLLIIITVYFISIFSFIPLHFIDSWLQVNSKSEYLFMFQTFYFNVLHCIMVYDNTKQILWYCHEMLLCSAVIFTKSRIVICYWKLKFSVDDN